MSYPPSTIAARESASTMPWQCKSCSHVMRTVQCRRPRRRSRSSRPRRPRPETTGGAFRANEGHTCGQGQGHNPRPILSRYQSTRSIPFALALPGFRLQTSFCESSRTPIYLSRKATARLMRANRSGPIAVCRLTAARMFARPAARLGVCPLDCPPRHRRAPVQVP